MLRRMRWVAATLSVAVGSLFSGAVPASAQLLLNEVQVFGSEWVELYNDSGTFLDLGDFAVRGPGGDVDLPSGILLPPGGYIEIDLGPLDLLSDLGGETSVIDRTAGDAAIDKVTYGRVGSAPLPTAGTTLARAPDASAGTAPPDPLTDGLGWTIAFTPSGGEANTAPVATLGVDIRLNEFNAFPGGGSDQIELYNPTPSAIDVTGWFLVAGGMDPISLSGIVDAESAFAVDLPGVQLEATEVIYLFDESEVRLDQSGFAGAPVLDPDECVGLEEDGVAPILGFDFSTAGLVVLECSIGDPNDPVTTPLEQGTWGTLKSVFR